MNRPQEKDYASQAAYTRALEAYCDYPAKPEQSHRTTGWMAPKDRYAVPVLFNPYTGEPRDVRDVASDPQGILIVPLGKVEMLAAKAPEQSEPTCRVYSVHTGPSLMGPEGTMVYEQTVISDARLALGQKLFATPSLREPEQSEPVGEASPMPGAPLGFTIAAFKIADVPVGTKLYTAPPLRELSDKEIMEVSNAIERSDFFDIVIPFARAILAAARSKT